MKYAFYIYLAILTLSILWVNIGKFNKAKLWTIMVVWFLIPGIASLAHPSLAIVLLYMAIFITGIGLADFLPDKKIGLIPYGGLMVLMLCFLVPLYKNPIMFARDLCCRHRWENDPLL
jgi:hypothetical protein